MRWLVLLPMLLLMLSSCLGVAYVPPQAVTRIEFTSVEEMRAAAGALTSKLQEKGFQSSPMLSGRSQSMLDTLPADARRAYENRIEFWREIGLPDDADIHISLLMLPDAEAKSYLNSLGQGVEAHFPLIELSISEDRPGGFTPAGLREHDQIESAVRAAGLTPIVVFAPPVDEREHDRIALQNQLTACVQWLIAWVVYASVILGLASRIMKAGMTLARRRAAIIAIGVLMVTPVPLPWMFGAVFVPNTFMVAILLAFDPKLITAVGGLILASFGASLVLSTAAAFLLVRNKGSDDPRPDPSLSA